MSLFDIEFIWLFWLLLPLVACMYAAVGHGGASGYLAIMALFSIAPNEMRPTALLLNLFVSAVSFLLYWREGHFNSKLFFPFIITSIPFAFVGGTIDINTFYYQKILMVFLLFAMLKVLWDKKKPSEKVVEMPMMHGVLIGGAIGFFSGLMGIGGGIILSPIILFMRWGRIKETAAVSALFIWVNSAAGMAGQLYNGVTFKPQVVVLIILVLLGGYLGAYFGSKKVNSKYLRYVLAFVLALACLKLFLI